MPTVLRQGGYRFYFYSNDRGEPPHIHVDGNGDSAKFWLDPVTPARNLGFPSHEFRRLMTVVEQHRDEFLEAWDEHFGPGSR